MFAKINYFHVTFNGAWDDYYWDWPDGEGYRFLTALERYMIIK